MGFAAYACGRVAEFQGGRPVDKGPHSLGEDMIRREGGGGATAWDRMHEPSYRVTVLRYNAILERDPAGAMFRPWNKA